MTVPFLDLKIQYQRLRSEIEPAVCHVLESGIYIGGEAVKIFEHQAAVYLGTKHAVACSDGTSALVLALRACGIGPGDEVITTAFSFFATAEAVASIGAVPVFVDIRPEDYTIDPDKIEDALTERTKAIIPVHIFGAACDMDRILPLAKKHNLYVIEDAAQAFGSEYKGRKAGTLGDIACFSFYPTKNLGCCGDGGMCTTNDDRLAVNLLALREHGAGKNGAQALENITGKRETAESDETGTELYDPLKYFNYLIAYNSRLDAVQAAVLSVKLQHLDDFNSRRAYVADCYFKGLTSKVVLPQYSADNKTCWHQFVIRSKYKQELCSYLMEHGVGNGSFYPVPLHRQKAFSLRNCKNPGASLPSAEALSRESVCLPIFPELNEEQIRYVIDTVNRFYEDRL